MDWVALLPLGQTLPVEHNQTLIRLVQDDLDRRMDRLLLDKKQFIQRKEVGSPSAILLGIKERELPQLVSWQRVRRYPHILLNLLKTRFKD